MTIQGNNIIALTTGGVLVQTDHSGIPDSPNPPVVTAIVDNDMIIVTVTGDAGVTHTVTYKTAASDEWIIGDSRLGDGDIIISGLASDVYHIIAYSSIGGAFSQPSNLLSVSILTIEAIEVAVRSLIYNCTYPIVGSRIYPQTIPQDAQMPAIRYNLIAAPRRHTLTEADGLVFARMQVDILSENYATARQLAEVVRKNLDVFAGTVGGVHISVIQLIDEQDYFAESPGSESIRRYGKTQDYTICYSQEMT